ncbi:MAG TPA: hypothetical protein VIJ95_09020 [Hanamia sp.]
MALVVCPDCGTSVSDMAEKCPKCSYPIKPLAKTKLDIEVLKKSSSMIWSGYAMAILSLFVFPLLFMGFGIVFGVTNITKNEVGHGIAQIILSLFFGILGRFLCLFIFIPG